MARGGRAVVQVERLSDQVYEFLREDLKSGEFTPGQRLLEVELAEKYKVSRTPVREALFQLSREGLLTGNERGYTTPIYSKADIMYRLEVKRLLDPKVAEHVALDADAQQVKALTKALEREKSAHAAGKAKAFINANQDMRKLYRSMCKNDLLARCLTLVDDQFEVARSRIHETAENRQRTIDHDTRLVAAIVARDPEATAAEMTTFLDFIATYYAEHPPSEFG